MAHYQLFVPRRNLRDLERIGVGELMRPGDRTAEAIEGLEAGPDGGPGQILWWPPNLARGYQPSRQLWTPARPNKLLGRETGCLWIGFDLVEPPGPEDLIRSTSALVGGPSVRLADDREWIVPRVSLRARLPLDHRGQPMPTRSATRATLERSRWAEAALEDLFVNRVPIDDAECFAYCTEMLATNYRVSTQLCGMLGIFDAAALREVMLWTVDAERLQALRDGSANDRSKTAESN